MKPHYRQYLSYNEALHHHGELCFIIQRSGPAVARVPITIRQLERLLALDDDFPDLEEDNSQTLWGRIQ